MSKCEKCGSENVVQSKINCGVNGPYLQPEHISSRFDFDAVACEDCGSIFDFKIRNLDKFQKKASESPVI